jgi:hypothetical protein
MTCLEHELNRNTVLGFPGDGKAHCVRAAGNWKPRTFYRVSEIAGFKLCVHRHPLFMAGGAAGSPPACSKRQTGRMLECQIIRSMSGGKKRTCQNRVLLFENLLELLRLAALL